MIARVGRVVATMPLEPRADRPAAYTRAEATGRAGFDEIVERYQVPLRRLLYGVVQDYELAPDLSQDTFLSAYRALPRLELGLAAAPSLLVALGTACGLPPDRLSQALTQLGVVCWTAHHLDELPPDESEGEDSDDDFDEDDGSVGHAGI